MAIIHYIKTKATTKETQGNPVETATQASVAFSYPSSGGDVRNRANARLKPRKKT